MPLSLEVKPSGPRPQDLDTQKVHLLVVVLFSNRFSIQLLGQAGQAISCVLSNVHIPDSYRTPFHLKLFL